ncbi:MAG: cytochrome b N-terminal domain-containing protein, partial [Patescibacteria group bacterium]|nr:cytochrome b N-terminal domain-containing protein [Patescibacteria group bacterium]
MNAVLQWIDERTGILGLYRSWAEYPVPRGAAWRRIIPCLLLFAVVVQAMTGFVLMSYYTPSDSSAWESVYYLQNFVAGGWLLRAIHHYTANLTVALIGLYLIQLVLTAQYRKPRELVFWAAIVLGCVSLGLMLTGDLLSWDRNSYSATLTRFSYLKLVPIVGGDLYKIAIGGPGPVFSHLTLPRFQALHIGAFGATFIGLVLLLHYLLARAERLAATADQATVPRWPNATFPAAVACAVFMALVLALSLSHGTAPPHAGIPLGSPADPADGYAAARPEWAFLGLYRLVGLFPGEYGIVPIFVLPSIAMLLVVAMPLTGRTRNGYFFNVAVMGVLVLGNVVLAYQTIARDAASTKHQAAIANERQRAERVVRLAQLNEGIPPDGALALLRRDPKTQGPQLFEVHCASCHSHATSAEHGIAVEHEIVSEAVSAPNLGGYGTREWVAGWLDVKRITSDEYFGKTKFRAGKMVGAVREMFDEKKMEDEDRADREKLVAALSAEAKLPAQAKMDKDDAAMIAEGRELVVDFGCTGCHKFHGEGALGNAPDLTGYASREWTAGILRNPMDRRYYGESNDRMPA